MTRATRRVPCASAAATLAPEEPPAPLLEGSLGELALADVLQLLELGRRTGVLRVWDGARGSVGAVHVRNGDVCRVLASGARPLHAAEDASAMIDAIGALLGVRGGRFAFTPEAVVPCARPVRVERLLVEAMRRADEWARLGDVVPGAYAVAVLADGGGRESVAPTARQWALLAELDGARDVAALAVALARAPLDVAGDLAILVRAGLAALVSGGPTCEPSADPDLPNPASVVPNGAPRSSLG